jgi:hypothetical protein
MYAKERKYNNSLVELDYPSPASKIMYQAHKNDVVERFCLLTRFEAN